ADPLGDRTGIAGSTAIHRKRHGKNMIEKLPRSEGNSIGYEVTDTLSEAEYEEILADVEAAIDEHGSAKLLIDLSDVSDSYAEFDAYEEDLGFYLRHGEEMECYAVVGDDVRKRTDGRHAPSIWLRVGRIRTAIRTEQGQVDLDRVVPDRGPFCGSSLLEVDEPQ
ncbi:STAS/SEC14 domain-containing protein, partial [Natronococcus sp.]|uniref:STAS/SEC14 domain-containing protein n=1 Tax=Natronococcus sp. TaxID=35747 RepID=UPI003A4DA80C